MVTSERDGTVQADDFGLALALAELAAETALPLFRRGVASEKKSDDSVVTEADRSVEQALVRVLARERPADAVLSEECGALGSGARRWILDPIDGTAHFATANDCWGTHVALEVAGRVVLGVITRPVAGDCFWGVRGQGAHRGRLGSDRSLERLRVSDNPRLSGARIMLWARSETGLGARLRSGGQWVPPALDGILDVARGRLDALIDELSYPWDLAPGLPIIEEAGGRFRDGSGGTRLDHGGGCFTNGRIDGELGWP
jgi:histidinol-phosphatase